MGTRVFAAATALILLFAVCLPLRTFALDMEIPTQITQNEQPYPETATPTDARPAQEQATEPTVKIVSCVYIFTDDPNVIVPLGTSPDDLRDYFEWVEDIAILKTEDGDIFFAPLTLVLDAIDTNTAGVYYPIKLDLPEGAVFAEGLEFFSLGVHVVPTGVVDLRAISFYQSGYIVQWMHPAKDPVLWAAVDDGEWLEIPGESDNKAINKYGCFFSNGQIVPGGMATGLGLIGSSLTAGHVYNFQVQYDGDRFSDILTLDLMDGSLPKATNASGGDRNGGDRGETQPPKPPEPPESETPPAPPYGTQGGITPNILSAQGTRGLEIAVPALESTPKIAENSGNSETPPYAAIGQEKMPTRTRRPEESPEAKPLPVAPAPAEYVNEHSITISGERLAAMAEANPQYVSFILEGLRVSVPTAYILELGLRSSEPFTVTLYQPNDLSFAVAFSLGDMPLSDTFIKPFFVSIPWNGGPVSCKRAFSSGDSIEGALDTASGKASFALYQTGTYFLTKHADALLAQQYDGHGPTQIEAAVGGGPDSNASSPAPSGAWWPAALISLAVLTAAGMIVILVMRRSNIAFGRASFGKRVNAP